MQVQTGKSYNGFKLIEKDHVKEIDCDAYIFVHEKTGAKLLVMPSDDNNKVFSIGFKTPPEDSTGLPHILEHCVLCGSRKFPSKKPFVELVKGSLNTFLNAMTYPDKTIYPVASTNEKDLYNLMDVYLDGVFYPKIYEHPEIFMQEGWHHELKSEDDNINYNGVVYNEMKGSYSSPQAVLSRRTVNGLFPDTPYSHDSGGDPDVIPDLTYQQFIEFHKKYYHPSNSFIFLYGNGDMLKQMEFINNEYLSKFDKIDIDVKIPKQPSFTSIKEQIFEYPASQTEDLKDKTFMDISFALEEDKDYQTMLAMEMLTYMLLQNPAAPLKKALIKAGIAKNITGHFETSLRQAMVSITAKNSNEDSKEKFIEIVFDTLRALVKEGIHKDIIEGAINKKEFYLREGDFRTYPKGLIYYMKSMTSWLYEGHPLSPLRYEEALSKIKDGATSGYFEKLIQKHILDNKHCLVTVLRPKRGMTEKREEEIRNSLDQYKNDLSKEQISKLIDQTKSLKLRQSTPDSPEAIASIPHIELKDINTKAEIVQSEMKDYQGVKMLFTPQMTNGIVYLSLAFKCSKVKQELIPYGALLSSVLGKMGAGDYDYTSLANAISINIGDVSFSAKNYLKNKDYKKYTPLFLVKAKMLGHKAADALDIVSKIISSTVFDDKERLLQIIRETKAIYDGAIINNGHMAAISRAQSYINPRGHHDDIMGGIGFYKFIVDLEKNFDSKYGEIVDSLKEVSKQIFNKNNLLIGLTCQQEDISLMDGGLDKVLGNLDDTELKEVDYDFNLENKNEGLMTQSKVQYVVKAGNFIKSGYSYTGSLRVLRTILSYDYLWNKIRVQGGAYGALIDFSKDGSLYISSYRDPKLKETLEVYDNLDNYLNEVEIGDEEMTKYIIGTISKIDAPLTPPMAGERALFYHISGVNFDDIQRERDEILNTKPKDIKSLAPVMKNIMEQNHICVLGNENKIKENKDVFNNLISVFE